MLFLNGKREEKQKQGTLTKSTQNWQHSYLVRAYLVLFFSFFFVRNIKNLTNENTVITKLNVLGR